MIYYEALEPVDGVMAQFAAVHIVRWRPGWGAPTLLFNEVDDPLLDAAPDLLAACELGEGFHTDGATLLEEAAYYLEGGFAQLADELRRKAAMERAAIHRAKGE